MTNVFENEGGFDFTQIQTIPCSAERNVFVVKKANEWSEEAAKRPNPRSLWHNLWFEGEVCCLFADSNLGKSILAVQIAEEVARTEKVLYFDFELTDKQFQRRYTNEETGQRYIFSENFYRVELNAENNLGSNIVAVIDEIEIAAKNYDVKNIIIDNISWLTNKCESGDTAGELMSRLIQMKKRGGFSILVLAHTPKRNTNTPLTQNSLAGSKKIANFMDSIFALGASKKELPISRYIKQIKVRSCEMKYGEDNVIEAKITKYDDFLRMELTGFGTERENLDEPDLEAAKRAEADQEIARRLREGESYRSIAHDLGVSTKTVGRVNRQLSPLNNA